MQFSFTILVKEGSMHFTVRRVYQGQSVEKFLVTLEGANSILVQSNRPYLLHHKLDVPITWKQLKGRVSKNFFTVLCQKIAEHLKDDLLVIQPVALSLF